VLAALAVLAAGPSAVAHQRRHRSGCAHAQTQVTSATRAQIAQAVLCLINHRRWLDKLPPLRASRRLTRSAQSWTDDMVRRNLFAHGAGANSLQARTRAAGYASGVAGETIASGFTTPAAVVAAWMASPRHCRTILSPLYRDAGVGLADKAIGGAATGATWTGDYGNPIGTPAPSGNWAPARSCLRHS
jgi:uncharacterized protein YkwD